jgi:hypothetical protein
MRFTVHGARMRRKRNLYRVFEGKPEKKTFGRENINV